MAGCLSAHIGGTALRNFSPCGECLDKGGPILLSRPDLKYDYLRSTGLELSEVLVVPFTSDEQAEPLGAIWVVSHPPLRHHFDLEDVKLMQSIGHFSAAAYCLATARDTADGLQRQHEHAVAATTREMRTPLNTIAGSIYLLLLESQGTMTPAQVEHLARIQKAVTELQVGVNGLAKSAQTDRSSTSVAAELRTPLD